MTRLLSLMGVLCLIGSADAQGLDRDYQPDRKEDCVLVKEKSDVCMALPKTDEQYKMCLNIVRFLTLCEANFTPKSINMIRMTVVSTLSYHDTSRNPQESHDIRAIMDSMELRWNIVDGTGELHIENSIVPCRYTYRNKPSSQVTVVCDIVRSGVLIRGLIDTDIRIAQIHMEMAKTGTTADAKLQLRFEQPATATAG